MKLILAILALTGMMMADNANDKLLTAANDKFTAKMFTEVVKNNPNKSVILSAYSVLTPLALLSLAAEGPSHDELVRIIGMANDDTTKQVFSQVTHQLKSVKGIELKQANRVYIPLKSELNKEFEATAHQVFESEVKNVDFSKTDDTANAINSWVESQTNNRIKDLVKPSSLSASTQALLVNALYFKGQWIEKFDPAKTEDRDFHVTKNKTIKVPTMSKKAGFEYSESKELDAKLLRLHYVGKEASMLIVLPNQIDGLAALEEKLKDPEALTKATNEMFHTEVDVRLPKFKIETETDLKNVLTAIGVKLIFEPATAKLNNLLKGSSNSLYVSEAIQKAFIEVNEEGAEAAAANVIEGLSAASGVPRLITFTADRPFYFAIEILDRKVFSGSYQLNENKT